MKSVKSRTVLTLLMLALVIEPSFGPAWSAATAEAFTLPP